MSKWLSDFGRGCNLSQRCLTLLMSYRRGHWVVPVVLGIAQKSSFLCHQYQVFFNKLLLILVLMVSKNDFNSHHRSAWLYPLFHPLSFYRFVVDFLYWFDCWTKHGSKYFLVSLNWSFLKLLDNLSREDSIIWHESIKVTLLILTKV